MFKYSDPPSSPRLIISDLSLVVGTSLFSEILLILSFYTRLQQKLNDLFVCQGSQYTFLRYYSVGKDTPKNSERKILFKSQL